RWPQPRWASTLTAEPGARWDYSDPAMAHLALVFARVAKREMADVMQERVFGPIGVEQLVWDLQGVGTRFGPHTNAHTGIHVSARELARFGYLMMRQGRWGGRRSRPLGRAPVALEQGRLEHAVEGGVGPLSALSGSPRW